MLGQLDFECVVLVRLGVLQGDLGGGDEIRFRRLLPDQRLLGVESSPRLRRHAAERQPGRADDAVADFEGDGRRRESELETRPVAHLYVVRAGRQRRCVSSTAVISSPCSRTVSRSGWSSGTKWKSVALIERSPFGPPTFITASSATRATAMSDGCVAMQWSLTPRTA